MNINNTLFDDHMNPLILDLTDLVIRQKFLKYKCYYF